MKVIKSIDSIYPTELIFNLNRLDEKLLPNSEVEINVGITVKEFEHDDQGNFRAIVSFLLRVADEEEDLFKLSHRIEFTSSDENFNIKDRECNFALFEIVEPYIRYRFNELFSQTKFSSLEIPYRSWETIDDSSEI